MGNHLSCISPASLERLQQQVVSSNPDFSKSLIKILHYDGGFVAHLEEPLTAAEVMMESPGLFLCCHSHALSNAGRIFAIPADQDLLGRELYILMPMYKLNARFSSEEIAYFSELTLMQKKTNINGDLPPRHSQCNIAPSLSSFDKFGHGAESTQSFCRQGIAAPHLLMRSLSAKLPPRFAYATCSAPMDDTIKASDPPPLHTKGITMCRSKSWMPNLETITEARVAF